jgi:hypothetical protein
VLVIVHPNWWGKPPAMLAGWLDREREVFGDPLAVIWGCCVAPYTGDPVFTRRAYRVVGESTAAQRVAWLDDEDATIGELRLT